MTPDQLIEHFGSQDKAAQALGLTQPSVAEWKANGYIPELRQLHIERVTRGALKAAPIGPVKRRRATA